MAESFTNEKLDRAITDVVQYFYNNNKKYYATAIQNAQNRVRLFESCGYSYREYNQRVNKGLCEALFFMNSDPYCDVNHIKLIRKLIESYRDMNGLSTIDFATDSGEDKVATVVDGKFSDFPETNDKHTFILLNTEVGEEYNVEDLADALFDNFYGNETCPVKCSAANEEIMQTITNLINSGNFDELVQSKYAEAGPTCLAVIRVK